MFSDWLRLRLTSISGVGLKLHKLRLKPSLLERFSLLGDGGEGELYDSEAVEHRSSGGGSSGSSLGLGYDNAYLKSIDRGSCSNISWYSW